MPPSFDTIYPADTLEFCPNEGFHDLFVCGTYKLIERAPVPETEIPEEPIPAKRIGQCMVFRMKDTSSAEDELPFTHVQSLDFPAIPDVKWCHGSALEKPTLGVADSEGSISLCQLDPSTRQIQVVDSVRCADTTTLCLSLDWNNRVKGSSQLGDLVVSLSNGSLCHLQPDSTGALTIANEWHAHDFEPWIAAWNYHDTNIIYSGGDDLKLKTWDTRVGLEAPIFVNKRFDAGVTCIQSHPHDPSRIAVGSYDGIVRIFDTKNLSRPVSELNVEGGVWRVKWHPHIERKDDLLVACMHDGFKVARFPAEGGACVLKEFREHESLAYGADWSHDVSSVSKNESWAGTCSFYDHRLHVWSA